MRSGQIFEVNGRKIGSDCPPYVIAEMSCNHKGDKSVALELIKMAAHAGADAVKLQTYTPDTMTIDCDKPGFVIEGGLWDGVSLFELYQMAFTPWEWTEDLFEEAKKHGITIFSSPFDETAVDFLESFDPPLYKVASLELTDDLLLRRIAQTHKPVILSTGLADLEEISHAIDVLDSNGCPNIVLLHCISGYPTPLEDANIMAIPMLQEKFGRIVGLSDHTRGIAAAAGAVALGARVIEKHMVISRDDGSLDAAFSLEAQEFRELAKICQESYKTLGTANHGLIKSEEVTRGSRRSIYVVADIPKGEVLNRDNVRRIRPGFGMSASRYETVLGRKVVRNLERGHPLSEDDLI